MVPQITVQQVLVALGLKTVLMVRHRLFQHVLELKHFRQVGHPAPRFGIRKPDAVAETITGMAVKRQTKWPTCQLLTYHFEHCCAFKLHRRTRLAAVPGQQRAEGLPTRQKRHTALRTLGRVAHQVHAPGIGPFVRPHARRINDGHKNQANFFQLPQQQLVPRQPVKYRLHVVQHDLRANTLKAMNAAKKTNARG